MGSATGGGSAGGVSHWGGQLLGGSATGGVSRGGQLPGGSAGGAAAVGGGQLPGGSPGGISCQGGSAAGGISWGVGGSGQPHMTFPACNFDVTSLVSQLQLSSPVSCSLYISHQPHGILGNVAKHHGSLKKNIMGW